VQQIPYLKKTSWAIEINPTKCSADTPFLPVHQSKSGWNCATYFSPGDRQIHTRKAAIHHETLICAEARSARLSDNSSFLLLSRTRIAGTPSSCHIAEFAECAQSYNLQHQPLEVLGPSSLASYIENEEGSNSDGRDHQPSQDV
jgi:hypothetical protein